MVRHVDAIFSQGAFRPLEPVAMPEGTRVHLSVEEKSSADAVPPPAKIHTPKLAHGQDAADFAMEESWATLQRLWKTSNFNSTGDY